MAPGPGAILATFEKKLMKFEEDDHWFAVKFQNYTELVHSQISK